MSSVAEMKPSQVLREALKLMDGGKKWIKGAFFAGNDKCCSLGALRSVASSDSDEYMNARAYLAIATNATMPAYWNDHAADFSVIEQGFQKAVALAESEGK